MERSVTVKSLFVDKMKWVFLQKIFLLVFYIQFSSIPAAKPLKCISETEVKNRTDKFLRKGWDRLRNSQLRQPAPPDTRKCAQIAKEMYGNVNNRSLSPWKYELNLNDSRYPQIIYFAKCLCEGCIINGREDKTYNSVLVFVQLVVMEKTACRTDPKTYEVKRNAIDVPVACTCVVPKYAKK
ncbi:Interleukin-17C [Channa argus]|uniref:Interleukin-17C n=1 Tax=Channa argus TaxID=215402 RepID=A0A6G1P9I4_CHAAH|nr:Interleukin-17C [Channa argus]KAK2919849.1 hypothetical protein Q8A73_002053 [Channa argus]